MAEINECAEHGLRGDITDEGYRDRCVACDHDVEVRLDVDVPGELKPMAIRNPIKDDTLVELYGLMGSYLDDIEEGGEHFVTLEGYEGQLPAGYAETERVVNVIVYYFGSCIKAIDTEQSAQETIETLRGNGYTA